MATTPRPSGASRKAVAAGRTNHAFIDGNKRVGAASALVFLAINGIQIEADEEGLVELTLQVASSRADKARIASFLRERTI